MEQLSYDITKLPGQDLVLGLPWLERTNPVINWRKRTMKFGNNSPVKLADVNWILHGNAIAIDAISSKETNQVLATSRQV